MGLAREVRDWTFGAALPLWAEAGLDRARGGYHEELTLSGAPAGAAFKRTRVACRQLYVFSHAVTLGWQAGAAAADHGYDFLVRHARLEARGAWARRLDPDGRVIDPTPDLYDLAFVMFALAWRYRASGERSALEHLHATLDFIEARMAAPEGYWHWLPASGWRQQNPHMHLLEACLAAFEATNDERFLARARALVDLFRRRFFDGRTLAEFFTDDWARAPAPDGTLVEPGHQFEWAWILTQYARLADTPPPSEAVRLVQFAESLGVDPVTRFTYNQVDETGAVRDGGSRAWPNTERIKGHLALEGAAHDAAADDAVRLLFARHLNVAPRGLWVDLFDANGAPVSKTVPASTLYHVFLAFSEHLRVRPETAET